MTTQDQGALIDAKVPTLYVGFSSVLHRGEGLVDEVGSVTLDSGDELFNLAPLLVDVLMPYPCVQLVLTTSWTRTLGEERTIAMLPPGVIVVVASEFLYQEESEVQVEGETNVFCRVQGAGALEGPAARQPNGWSRSRRIERERFDIEEMDEKCSRREPELEFRTCKAS
jgi:hypothetical protein